jgi:hypothetical protein
MSFTDQKPRIATEEECRAPWGGAKDGSRFRCYLCGLRFNPGDEWRWIYAGHKQLCNFMVCSTCDGPDVLERWKLMNIEAKEKFWWLG